MPLDLANTTLAVSPYFDDYDAEKNFHRVLFRPGTAVQARELTQLQTVLQNQIERFGDSIYKNGSIVHGCAVEYIKDLEFIGVEDQFMNSSGAPSLTLDIGKTEVLVGAIAIGQKNGVHAQIVSTRAGFASANPNRLFLRYTKTGTNDARTFEPGETIKIYDEGAKTYVEDIIVGVVSSANFQSSANAGVGYAAIGLKNSANTADVYATGEITSTTTGTNQIIMKKVSGKFAANTTNDPISNFPSTLMLSGNPLVNSVITTVSFVLTNYVGQIRVANSTLNANSAEWTGFAFGAHVSPGIIYHKGHFIRVDGHDVVVSQNSVNPAGYSLGFVTKEEIITENADDSLYDNAMGSPNYNAPGAHRLQLISTLQSRLSNSVITTDTFFPIIQFGPTGAAIERTDPQYSTLGDEFAKRTYEESGHYIIKPFAVSSNTNPKDSSKFTYNISPGLAYVKGRRNELLSNIQVEGRRGTNVVSYDNQVVTTSYGNYVKVKEVRGVFAPGQTVTFYPAAATAASSAKALAVVPSGDSYGSATVREIIHESGYVGAADEQYRLYLYNIKMANAQASFANVASIWASTSNTVASLGYADVITGTGIQDAALAPMIFSLGAKAVKSLSGVTDTTDNSYYYNGSTTTTMANNGVVSFTIPGPGIFGFSDPGATEAGNARIVLTTNAEIVTNTFGATANVSGASNNAVGFFELSLRVFPGEGIRIGSNNYLVLSDRTGLANSHYVKIASTGNNLPSNGTGVTISRVHFAGSPISLEGDRRTFTANVTTGIGSIDLTAGADSTLVGNTYTFATTTPVTVKAYTLRSNAVGTKKDLKKSSIVRVVVSGGGADRGPWNLGFPDVFRINGVYDAATGADTADLSRNLVQDFGFNDGQTDSFYDHSSIYLKAQANAASYASKRLLVEFDHFIANTTSGNGFFSIDSYPVDDAFSANNASIRTWEIPSFYSAATGKYYDLRDCLDFRPYKANTVAITNSITAASATTPATTTLFDASTSTIVPYPGQNFECNFSHYVGRKDILTITPAGEFVPLEGVASLTPRLPQYPAETLAIATVDIPPYPSLADNERAASKKSEYAIRMSMLRHKRFTMSDISAIEQRVQRLEYYTSLNALEKSATDMQVSSSDGVNRFKNGIFVDPMNTHMFGRVDDPQYRIAIDETKSYARPFFFPEYYELEYSSGAGVRQSGDHITLDYEEEQFLVQSYATEPRQLSGAPPAYNGTLILKPNRWSELEVCATPVSVTSVSKSSDAVREMESPILCMRYGWWRRDNFYAGHNDEIVKIGTPNKSDNRDKTISVVETTYTSENDVPLSVEVQPYIRAREISFRASGLKPYTKFFMYIDDVEITEYVAPGVLYNEAALDEAMIKRTGQWGDQIESNSRGEVHGKISLPIATFKTGRHTVKLISERIDVVTNAQVSSAAGLFEVDFNYDTPPPMIVIEHPRVSNESTAPSVAVPAMPAMPAVTAGDTSPANNAVAPTAEFSEEGSKYVTPGTNHVIVFNNRSAMQNSSVTQVSRTWTFGDGTSNTTHDVVTQTFSNNAVNEVQDYNVTLSVTDSNGKTSSVSHPITLYKLQPSPIVQVTPVNVAANTCTIRAYAGYALGKYVEGLGKANSILTATANPRVTGGYFVWTISNTQGGDVTVSAPEGALGDYINNIQRLTCTNATSQMSTLDIVATYRTAGGIIANSAPMSLSFKTWADLATWQAAGNVSNTNTIGTKTLSSKDIIKPVIVSTTSPQGDIISTTRSTNLHIV